MAKAQKLGRYLEQHGDRLRVVIRVPPSLHGHFGKGKLKEALPAGTSPRHAETLKWDVVARLKGQIRDAKNGTVKESLASEAIKLREGLRTARPIEYIEEDGGVALENPVEDVIATRAEAIQATQGDRVAQDFADIAFGRKTPFRVQLAQMFEREALSIGYQQDIERALSRLETWCQDARLSPVVESLDIETASRYVHEQFIRPKAHHKTANKDISALSVYWKFLKKHLGLRRPNPWAGLRLPAPSPRQGQRSDKKRPFTDAEVTALLSGLALRRDWDFAMVAALSGMRENEIAALTVADCQGDVFEITRSKTGAGVRRVPIHPDLRSIVVARSMGKGPSSYIFDELPEQRHDSKRDRGAVIAQSFTRERRRLGIEERGAGQRQSNVDFHSWRRWFVRTAVEAINRGARGYTVYTIAHVVGHKITEGGELEGVRLSLAMTMGVYAGPASEDSLRACVAAVQLPLDAPRKRSDLVAHRKGGRRPSNFQRRAPKASLARA